MPLHRGAAAFWKTGAPCLQAMWIINQTETMTINSSEAVLLALPSCCVLMAVQTAS